MASTFWLVWTLNFFAPLSITRKGLAYGAARGRCWPPTCTYTYSATMRWDGGMFSASADDAGLVGGVGTLTCGDSGMCSSYPGRRRGEPCTSSPEEIPSLLQGLHVGPGALMENEQAMLVPQHVHGRHP
jgi:hypothetical protein